jgi:predicted SAM-dependent methyltransferase
VKLNLGCSDSHMAGCVNVDVCEPADVIADLSKVWPWPDSSVDSIHAWDILEHMPDKKFTMNEAHRVLKPGANIDIFIPTTDGRGAFQDPTHQSFWTPNDLFYFCDEYVEWQRFHVAYGITACFRIVSNTHQEFPNKVWKARWVLQAVKTV